MQSLRARMARVGQSYAPHDHRPLGGYAAAMGAFGALAVSLAGAAKVTGKPFSQPSAADVILLSVATHKLSRLLAKDAVTSPLRAPFTRYAEPAGAAELNEEVRHHESSLKHGIGELVSCPFCLAVWVATGLTGGLVLAPRLTRLAAVTLTATAVSDFLQLGYDIAKKAAEGD
ncbi:DUF1360 domain-containing protein [Actinoplanes sp. LDG1-06]|uniref:DUF1360 domain-containing protein n=1 Tax=Paractinoplanes ovalisporus TaxID=2810368 RepID=A0ABS2AFV3_9ACTN|nr:DUF1360 domain-containing protein [Actinoplanes ovalisporus]MBM2618699.1 DUF1360 domain-containing protein [Actinoplanes ovalisporus]